MGSRSRRTYVSPTAPTIISGGAKDNVLPIEASATVSLRLLPGDSLAAGQYRVREIIADPLVQVHPLAPGQEASPVSRTDGAAFRLRTSPYPPVAQFYAALIRNMQ